MIDLDGPTFEAHHWNCCICKFSTTSLALALQHCEERSGDFPNGEHLLHELPNGEKIPRRIRARRVISCRDGEGNALNARVCPNRWRWIDGRWEIVGVTAARRVA